LRELSPDSKITVLRIVRRVEYAINGNKSTLRRDSPISIASQEKAAAIGVEE
jgi:hypothetical protein